MASNPFDLGGRVALVTGSSKGLGRAMAQGLASAGAKVAVNYHSGQSAADQTVQAIQSSGGIAKAFQADVTDPDDCSRLISDIQQTLGAVDILVLNATCEQPLKPIEEYDWAFYQRMLDFFVKSPFLLCRECLPHMKQQRWGRIINITSEVFHIGASPFTAYVSAKGGQVGFSRSLARELAPHGITVNMIAPGWIPVERHANDSQEAKDNYLKEIPAQRWGVPEDLIGAVVYFASESSSFATGQTISINGGHTVD